MLYLRSLELRDLGDRKNPNRCLRCAFSVDKNKYAVTRTTTIFENTESTRAAFTALCEDFAIEEEDKVYPVSTDEQFTGEFVTLGKEDGVPMHKVIINGKAQTDNDGNEIISQTLNIVVCETFGQTKESVLRSYLRSWKKQGAIVEEAVDEEQVYEVG